MFRKILFIGLGGAGQRHLRIVKKIMPNASCLAYRQLKKTPLLNSDFSINSNTSLKDYYGIDVYDDIDAAYANNPDLVIISVPTSMHYEHIIRASNEGASILVEKPGSVNYKEAKDLSTILKKNKTKFMISFQRRFHPYIVELKKQLKQKNIRNITHISVDVCSYVPSWHPYEDYRSLYACQANLGGGVLLTESHEIDIIIWLLGYPKKIESKLNKREKMGLDIEDSANIILHYEKYKVNINLDFMNKKTKRLMLIKHDADDIILDFDSNNYKFKYYDESKNKIINNLTNDELFETQFNYFLRHNKYSTEYIDAMVNNLMFINECKSGQFS
jgi:predicted dehydrogenase